MTHIRQLTQDDLRAYARYTCDLQEESGSPGEPYYGPYGRGDLFDLDDQYERAKQRWTTSLFEPGWRRAWGAFDDQVVVGAADLVGGSLAADQHRVGLGMGVLKSHRRRGLGEGLLTAVIRWAQAQPSVDWLDLGVFADNHPARRLYEKLGFEVIGTTPDRFRMDGNCIDDLSMTLHVAS